MCHLRSEEAYQVCGQAEAKRGAVSEERRVQRIEAGSNIFQPFHPEVRSCPRGGVVATMSKGTWQNQHCLFRSGPLEVGSPLLAALEHPLGILTFWGLGGPQCILFSFVA